MIKKHIIRFLKDDRGAILLIIAVIAIVAALALRFLMPSASSRKQDPRDIKITDSAYGNVLSRGLGRFIVSAELVQAREIRIRKKKEKTGKGGGGGGAGSVSFSYFFTGAFACCEGPVLGFVRVWMDKKIVYDDTSASERVNKEGVEFRFALGTNSQVPDTMTDADFPVGERPAYINTVILYVDDMNLELVSNHIPNVEVELDSEVAPKELDTPVVKTGPDTGTDDWNVDTMLIDWRRKKAYAMETGAGPWIIMYEFDISSDCSETQTHDLTILPGDGGGSMELRGIDEKTGRLYGWHQYNPIGPETANIRAYEYNPSNKTVSKDVNFLDAEFLTSPSDFNTQHYPVFESPDGTKRCIFSTDFDSSNTTRNTILNIGLSFNSRAEGPEPTLEEKEPGLPASPLRPKWMTGAGNSTDRGEDLWIGWVSFDNIQFRKYSLNNLGDVSTTSYTNIHRTEIHGTEFFVKLSLNWVPYIDTSDNTIVMSIETEPSGGGTNRHWVFKWDPETETVLWKTEVPTHEDITIARGNTRINSNFLLLYSSGTTVTKINLTTGEDTEILASHGSDIDALSVYWDGFENILYTSFSNGTTFNVIRTFDFPVGYPSDSSVTLAKVLRWLFDSGGLVEGVDYDVSAVTDSVWGIIIESETTLGSLIEDILPMYFLILLQEDGKIIVTPRLTSAVATINVDSFMVNIGDDDDADPYVIELVDESELPIASEISYINPRQQYESAEATWRRPIAPEVAVAHRTVLDLKTPLILTEDVPVEAAYVWTYLPWNERSRITFKLPWEYIWLSPGDPIDIVFESGSTLRARIQACPIGQDWTMEITAVFEDTGALEAAVLAATPGGAAIDIIRGVLDSVVYIVDNLLRDQDSVGNTSAISYLFVSPADELAAGANYPGATVFRSDDGTNYDEILTEVEEVPRGVTVNALGVPRDVNATDLVNTLTVDMAVGQDDLASVTRLALYNAQNAAIIYKDNGEYEIIQYQTVVVVSSTQIRLEILSRGKRGTDTMVSGHEIGQTIIFLVPTAANPISTPLIKLGATRSWRPVTLGQLFENALDQGIVINGDGLRPWAPVRVTGVKDVPSTGDVTFSWINRSRLGRGIIGGVWRHPENDLPAAYEVDILASSGGAVLRTLTSSTLSVEYDTADRVTDGFDPMPASFFVRVYQISDQVGRGWSNETEVFV